MIITYETGKKIITHPSGVVVVETIEDLENEKEILIQDKKIIEEEINQIDYDLNEMQK